MVTAISLHNQVREVREVDNIKEVNLRLAIQPQVSRWLLGRKL